MSKISNGEILIDFVYSIDPYLDDFIFGNLLDKIFYLMVASFIKQEGRVITRSQKIGMPLNRLEGRSRRIGLLLNRLEGGSRWVGLLLNRLEGGSRWVGSLLNRLEGGLRWIRLFLNRLKSGSRWTVKTRWHRVKARRW